MSKRLLDLDKCTVMHFRLNNNEEVMELGGKLLVSHTSESDLGIIVQSNLKVDISATRQHAKLTGGWK